MFASLRNHRGAVLPMIGVVWTALLGATALGLGVGRLTLAATEVQNAADVAALAGAMAVHKFSDPENDAAAALAGNNIAMASAAPHLAELTIGSYDYDARQFVPNGEPQNSVRARVLAPIDNVFGGLIQRPTQDVEKIAYAALSGLRGGRPTLPIVIGDCNFSGDCMSDACMPRLTQVPNNSDTSAWTAFFQSTNTGSITSFVPQPCGGGNVTNVAIGDLIYLNNGQVQPALDAVDCLINLGMVEHLIPVVPCEGSFNQSKPIVGFATIILEHVQKSGGNKGIDLRGIFKADAIGVTGGALFGTGNIALVAVD